MYIIFDGEVGVIQDKEAEQEAMFKRRTTAVSNFEAKMKQVMVEKIIQKEPSLEKLFSAKEQPVALNLPPEMKDVQDMLNAFQACGNPSKATVSQQVFTEQTTRVVPKSEQSFLQKIEAMRRQREERAK